MKKRIIVSGGRDFFDTPFIEEKLNIISKKIDIDIICTGGAKGVDYTVDKWAKAKGINRVVFPANWQGERKSAGPLRNLRMVEYIQPDIIILFPGGSGTNNMRKIAKHLDIKTIEIKKK